MRTYTREELIQAWAEYNRQVLEHPEKFQPEGVQNGSIEEATIAVDYLLSLLPNANGPRENIEVTKTTGNTSTKS